MNSNWSYSPETANLGQIRRFLEPCDLEIWRMTLTRGLSAYIARWLLEMTDFVIMIL